MSYASSSNPAARTPPVVYWLLIASGAAAVGMAVVASAAFRIGVLICLLVGAAAAPIVLRQADRLTAVLLFVNVLIADIAIPSDLLGEFDSALLLKGSVYGVCALAGVASLVTAPMRLLALPSLYVMLVLASGVYSVAPGLSLTLGAVLAAQLLFAARCAVSFSGTDLNAVWRLVALAQFVKVLGTIVMLPIAPSYALHAHDPTLAAFSVWGIPRLGGDFLGPNGLGFDCAILGILAVHLMGDRSLTRWSRGALRGVFVLAVTALIATQSRTAIMTFLIGLLLQQWRVSRRRALALLFVLGVLIGTVGLRRPDEAIRVLSRGQGVDSLASLEGRTQIWAVSSRLIRDRIWFGHGYGATRVILPEVQIPGAFHPYQTTHSIILESMINVGVVGTLVLLSLFAVAVARWLVVRRRMKFVPGSWSVAGILVIVLAVRGIGEAPISGGGAHSVLLFFISYFVIMNVVPRQDLPGRESVTSQGF